MKKKLITILCILMSIFLIFVMISGVKHNTNLSNYSIDYTWTDENRKYISDIYFRYNTIKEEETVSNVFLKENSIIRIENFKSEENCLIKILDNNNIINKFTIKQNSTLENIVSKDGDYNLILIFKPGIGEGKISIINN